MTAQPATEYRHPRTLDIVRDWLASGRRQATAALALYVAISIGYFGLRNAERLQPIAQRQQALNRRGELRDVLGQLRSCHTRTHAITVALCTSSAPGRSTIPFHLRSSLG
jgi:hypothetical protein